MQKKVEKVFIAKSINRTGSVTIGNMADGEVVVLDKNKNALAAAATVADSDVIYIAEGLSGTYDYVTPDGTAVTGVRQILVSDPIQGVAVATYNGKEYEAAAEAVVTVSGTMTPVVGTEYVLRIVYPDVCEHPGQFTYTYREVATSATPAVLWTAFAAQINAHAHARVTATSGATSLVLTAKAYDDNDDVDSINEYAQVIFEVFLFSGNFDAVGVVYTTPPTPGSGTWKLVRDEEKWAQGYEGLLNRTAFPSQVPTFRTVKSATYDCIVINHKNWYTASNSTEKQVDITTKIYVVVGAGQATDILASLNPWMASLPKAFANVSI